MLPRQPSLHVTIDETTIDGRDFLYPDRKYSAFTISDAVSSMELEPAQ